MFSSHSFWTSSFLDVPAGVTQEEGRTVFFFHLPSAVRALIVLARRIQPFISLIDLEVEFLCTNDLIVLHSSGIFIFIFYFFSEKKSRLQGSNSRPNVSEVTRLPLSYRGDRLRGGQKDVLRKLCIPKFKTFKIVRMLCTITTLLPIPKFTNSLSFSFRTTLM